MSSTGFCPDGDRPRSTMPSLTVESFHCSVRIEISRAASVFCSIMSLQSHVVDQQPGSDRHSLERVTDLSVRGTTTPVQHKFIPSPFWFADP